MSTRYFPLTVSRSDGKLKTMYGSECEENLPTADQMKDTPSSTGVIDYYRPIGQDEPKHLDWRRKLGGMLARELKNDLPTDLAAQPNERNCILAALPENYRLYEHIKARRPDRPLATSKASKNHAGGSHDRQDAYLYGHPDGRKKRYRSPADFFPHLLWLATDKRGDQNNCSCKFCCPEEIQNEKPTMKHHEWTTRPISVMPASKVDSWPSIRPSPASTPQSNNAQLPETMPLPGLDQENKDFDSQYAGLLFRPGEMVWMNLGSYWGIGMLVRRWMVQKGQNDVERHYVVQPLSYPGHTLSLAHYANEHLLRPWLSLSPPPVGIPDLQNQIAGSYGVTYESVPWSEYVDPHKDASILASESIDRTYTLFGPICTSVNSDGVSRRHWAGLFLGAEKVWRGEPVRLRLDSPAANPLVLVIDDILETFQQPDLSVSLAGRVYEFIVNKAVITAAGNAEEPASSPCENHLPLRMRRDLERRNEISREDKGSWRRLSDGVYEYSIHQIKSRWYESTLVLPIIMALQPRNEIDKQIMTDVSGFMNASNSSNQWPINRHETRISAFGSSVPAHLKLSDSLIPATDEELRAMSAPVQPRFTAEDSGICTQQGQTSPPFVFPSEHIAILNNLSYDGPIEGSHVPMDCT